MARKIDYTKLNADDLQYLSDRQWLIAEGDYLGHETSKAVNAWREDGTVPEAAGEDDGEGEGEGSGEIAYADGTVEQLKEELAERGLEVTGKKAELVARLEADDEAKAAAADDDIPEE